MQPRKVPMRMCVGCRTMRPKGELLRLVRSQGSAIAFDPTGKCEGRGAYVCPVLPCLQRAVKTRQLERMLSATVQPEVLSALQAVITAQGTANE